MNNIESIEEMNELFPWPTPGIKAMTGDEMKAIRIRLYLRCQQASGALANAHQAPPGLGRSTGL